MCSKPQDQSDVFKLKDQSDVFKLKGQMMCSKLKVQVMCSKLKCSSDVNRLPTDVFSHRRYNKQMQQLLYESMCQLFCSAPSGSETQLQICH